ncbi:MAG: hypothetical protein NC311_19595, partial [Muribaculaceae bacterium]|nr:hypothetical protein [Muribaculaceae bacterium]
YAEDLCMFRFVPSSTRNLYTMEISALGSFFGANGNSVRVAIVDEENAYPYILQHDEMSRLYTFADSQSSRWLTASGSAELVGYAFKEDPMKWYLEEVKDVTIETDANGYAAVMLPCGVEIPSSCKAFTVTSVSDGTAYAAELIGEIPAATPFVLKSTVEGARVQLPVKYVSTKVASAMSGTNIRRTDAPVRHELVSTADGFSFRQVSSGIVKANSAYLLADTADTLSVVIGEDPNAGVDEIPVDAISADDVFYDLSGRRVVNPAPGIYVNATTKKVVKIIEL